MSSSRTLLATLLIFAACSPDRVTTEGGISEPKEGSYGKTVAPEIHGTIAASGVVYTTESDRYYSSAKTPFSIPFDGKTLRIPESALQRMLQSLALTKEVRKTVSTTGGRGQFLFARSTLDPGEAVEAWAIMNDPGVPAYEDTYLTASAFSMLTGSSYAEDVSGDGTTIASVTIDPISTVNPEGMIRFYINGTQVVLGNPRSQSQSGGWLRTSSYMTAWNYSTGAVIAIGESHLDNQEPTFSGSRNIFALGFLAPVGHSFFNSLLPSVAEASAGCGTYMRNVLVGLAMMYYRGRRGDIAGFISSWVLVVNNMHAWARCMEQHPT